MDEKLTISLVGPKKVGKTLLLATATDSVKERSHGYSPEWRPMLTPITESEYAKTGKADGRPKLFDMPIGDYEKERNKFANGEEEDTPADKTFKYFFRLDLYGLPNRKPYLIQIIDVGGEIPFPRGGGEIENLVEVRDEFERETLAAEAIVFVVPLVHLDSMDWIDDMAAKISRLRQMESKKTKRVIVAFSQYERLFVRLGPSAFRWASDPWVAKQIICEALRSHMWLKDALHALESNASPVSVRFTVTSAYGFTKKFGNPNIDPHQIGEQRFRLAGERNAKSLKPFWRPFLTAEPFLYAALGEDSAFTFSFDALFGSAQAAASEGSSRDADGAVNGDRAVAKAAARKAAKPAKPGLLSAFKDIFDVNR